MKNIAILAICGVMLFGCSSTSSTNKNSSESFETLQQLINSKTFEIEADWAYPLGSSRVNLFGNSNYFRMQGDEVDVYLPYFGVRRSGPAYGNASGVEFKGAYKNLEIEEKPSKNEIIFNFDIRENSERFSVQVSVFANGTSSIYVDTSQRDDIRYEGKIVARTNN
jgi:hypothetical protein